MRATVAKAEPDDVFNRREMARTFSLLGKAYLLNAIRNQSVPARKKESLRDARDWFRKGLDVWQELRATGKLGAMNAGQLEEISREIARCEAGLSKP